jgi:hypothetical protein
MPIAPSFRSNSAFQTGTTSVTMAFPANYTTSDILVLVIETANDYVSALWATNLTNNGWARVANSNSFPGGTSATANAVYQDIWWSRPSTTSQTAVILGDAGDHTLGVCAAFSNCITSGSPWDTGTAAGINVKVSVATAQVNSYAVTTATANTLILTVINTPQDAASARLSVPKLFTSSGANDDTDLTERFDWGATSGGGGTIGLHTHRKPTAGLTANLRCNLAASNTAIIWTGALIGVGHPYSFSCTV